MLRKLGIPILAMAAALAAAVPSVSLARDRDDHAEGFRRDVRGDRDHDRRSWDFRTRTYAVPAPVPVPVPAPAPAAGYYDQYGVWHPYAAYPNGYYGY